ncbi:MAG: magnesium transporter MgtE [Selenomonadaceae bacterium]|nr:magnesium transporter MgtE [Selenomonadaceae bacterium]MDD7055530.1 magnesium transporter MgtE [Selenomonadaceae bacterium]MDY3915939.1 magnesium transporter MgtE [Selenomonadaceae bacterium]
MADNTTKKKGKGKKLLKLFLALFLILVIVVGGFILGIYLRIFDTQTMNEKLGLYNLPIIGQYFVKPVPKDEPAAPEENKPAGDTSAQQKKELQVTQKELEAQQKEREAAEKKRVSKLARLYNAMKPKDAAEAMDTLNDDLCIAILQRMDEDQAAKILSAFTPAKAGRLTQLMYEGRKKRLVTPEDQQKGAQPGEDQGAAGAQNAANTP